MEYVYQIAINVFKYDGYVDYEEKRDLVKVYPTLWSIISAWKKINMEREQELVQWLSGCPPEMKVMSRICPYLVAKVSREDPTCSHLTTERFWKHMQEDAFPNNPDLQAWSDQFDVVATVQTQLRNKGFTPHQDVVLSAAVAKERAVVRAEQICELACLKTAASFTGLNPIKVNVLEALYDAIDDGQTSAEVAVPYDGYTDWDDHQDLRAWLKSLGFSVKCELHGTYNIKYTVDFSN